MTLCIVWRAKDNICFASDSRLTTAGGHVDAGIKVVRVPFTLNVPAAADEPPRAVFSGDLGMTCAGATNVALMMKEALAEVVRNVQGVPQYHALDMDGVSDLLFRGFKVVCSEFGAVMFERSALTVVFAGWCRTAQRYRAFRMEHDSANQQALDEVLLAIGDFVVLGNGENAARALLPATPTERQFMDVLEAVIADAAVPGVGGNVQYGSFEGARFQPCGVAQLGATVHYWRGPLDLNGADFDQANELWPLFPSLDLVR